MILAAEASKTTFEIYTPVIVGLGAVVLGLLANSALEWWKTFLQRREEIRRIRHSILIELTDVYRYSQMHEEDIAAAAIESAASVNVSSFLMNMDREKIGALSKAEVVHISNVLSLMTNLLAAKEPTSNLIDQFNDVIYFNLDNDAEFKDMVIKIIPVYIRAVEDARDEILRNC